MTTCERDCATYVSSSRWLCQTKQPKTTWTPLTKCGRPWSCCIPQQHDNHYCKCPTDSGVSPDVARCVVEPVSRMQNWLARPESQQRNVSSRIGKRTAIAAWKTGMQCKRKLQRGSSSKLFRRQNMGMKHRTNQRIQCRTFHCANDRCFGYGLFHLWHDGVVLSINCAVSASARIPLREKTQ